MKFLATFAVLLVSLSSCRNSRSGEETESGRFGASDATVARDTNFKKRSCYCGFLLDSEERDPYRYSRSVSSGKSEACEYYTGEDGRGEHKLDTLIIEVYSGASNSHYEEKTAKLSDEFKRKHSDKSETSTRGANNDIFSSKQIGRLESRTVEKRAAYYNDFNGHLFVYTEKSMPVSEGADLEDIFDNLGERFGDVLDRNYQGACETDIEL